MNVFLLRHAAAKSTSLSGRDIDRELRSKGIAQAKSLKSKLTSSPLPNSIEVLCSSAKRTQGTLEIISDELTTIQDTRFLPEIYHASHHELVALIVGLNTSNDVLLIGHNPFISELASLLSGEDIEMSTCSWIHLSFPFDSSAYISQGTGTIESQWSPNLF